MIGRWRSRAVVLHGDSTMNRPDRLYSRWTNSGIDYAREVDDYKRYRSSVVEELRRISHSDRLRGRVHAVPYVEMSPGPMLHRGYLRRDQIDPKITGAKTYPTQGELNLTTVNERGGPYGEITLPEAFTGWIGDSDVVLPDD